MEEESISGDKHLKCKGPEVGAPGTHRIKKSIWLEQSQVFAGGRGLGGSGKLESFWALP